jgi:hypothetical protein
MKVHSKSVVRATVLRKIAPSDNYHVKSHRL